MIRANTSRQLSAILGFALLLSAVPSLQADTVDAVHDGFGACLLYTSDAADDLLCVDLGGRRLIKKKNKTTQV